MRACVRACACVRVCVVTEIFVVLYSTTSLIDSLQPHVLHGPAAEAFASTAGDPGFKFRSSRTTDFNVGILVAPLQDDLLCRISGAEVVYIRID